MSDLLDLVCPIGYDAVEFAPGVEIVLRVTGVLASTMLLAFVLRCSSAAVRHLVWALSLGGVLLLPIGYWAIPGWRWAVLPRPEAPSAAAVTETTAPRVVEVPVSTMPDALPPIVGQGTTTVPSAIGSSWSWSATLGAIWAAGTFAGLAWLVIGMIAVWRVARRAMPAAEEPWCRLLRQLEDQFGLRRRVELYESPRVSVPMTWGLGRPVILVPVGSADWSEEVRRSVLLHELGHIRRSDCLMHLLGRLACAAYWFHPLVWLAARQQRKTSEQAADDVVLASNIAPLRYASHLLTIARDVRDFTRFANVVLPMATPSDLESRVRAILDPQRNHCGLNHKSRAAVILLAASVLIPCMVLRLGYGAVELGREQTTSTSSHSQDPVSPLSDRENATETTQQPSRDSTSTADRAGNLDAKTAVIEGIVADENGRPEAGIVVQALGRTGVETSAQTDSAGRFQLRIGHRRMEPMIMNARSVDATRQAFFEFDSSFESRKLPQPVQLTMSRARQIETQVVASDGKPVAGALIGAIGGAVPGRDLATGRTDDNGHGTLLIPADAPLRHVYALKSGMGLDYVACTPDPEDSAVTADRSSLPEAGRAVALTLRGAKTARIRLVDPEGRPLPGLTSTLGTSQSSQQGSLT